MKKIFCIVAAILLTVSTVTAQETHFGLKAGVNLSSVDITNSDDFKSKAGIHIGGLAHIHINDHFALQPELVYSMQGGKDGDEKLNLNYINIPVLAQYMINDGFRLQTGPQLGFLTSAKSKVGDVEISVKDEISSIDFSWVFGFGYLFPSGFGLDARYNLGISNIRDNNDFKAKNRVFQFGLFYQFMHGKSAKRK
jgi:hypothetical protein